MKTQALFKTLTIYQKVSVIIVLIFTVSILNPLFAQTNSADSSTERIIKGIVSNDDGPLDGVNILLKGTLTGTTTDKKGAFTFPIALKTGDILVFSYLGYETQEFKIKNKTNFIKLVLTNDLVEIIGTLDENKPYKSKRSN